MKEKVKVLQLLDLDAHGGQILIGTINDVRIWAKNLWKLNQNYAKSIVNDETIIEENYYSKMDDDAGLMKILTDSGYYISEICEVPFDDFYDGEKPSQELIDEVIEQIKKDITEGDVTALDEMLNALPVQRLLGYLPEK